MFIRRWGNEGFCSGDQHYLTDLPADTYTFRLPWRPGASSVNVASDTTFSQTLSGASGPGVQWAPNEGVLVSFILPAPQVLPIVGCSGCNIIYGELHLQWPGGQGPAPLPGAATVRRLPDRLAGPLPARVATVRLPGQALPGEEPDKRLGSLLAKMTAIQRSQFLALIPRPPVSSYHPQALRQGAVSRIQSLPKRPARARRRQYRSVPDTARRQRNQRILDAVRNILGSRTLR